VDIQILGSHDTAAIRDEVVDVYDRAWTNTLFHPGAANLPTLGDRLMQQSGNPDFRLCVAVEGTAAVGFAYGYASVPGGWWRQSVAAHLGGHAWHRWLDDCFEFAELAVVPEFQGRGLGGRLHDGLLGGLQQSTALLSTQKANLAALSFYKARGWIVLNDWMIFSNRTEPYVIMGMDLTERPA
jgi:ribosomal protein S18 acetylase RimI-like enzyme